MNHERNGVRVVITGMGIVSPIGNDRDEILASIRRAETAVRPLDRVVRRKQVFAGKIAPDVIDEWDDPKVDRTGRIAVEAARRALADANGNSEIDLHSIGLALGTSHGGRSQLDRLVEEDEDPFSKRSTDRFSVVSTHHAQTEAVVSALKLGGPVVTLSNACSSSGSALEIALNWIRSGRCELAIAGGADGYAHLTQAGFAALGATSDAPNAPFSLPIGISLGEAAAFVVLETLDHALARNATIHAELFSCASTWDAYHLTEPEPSGDGLGRALNLALDRAAWDIERIGFVHAHGTGTRLNDTSECRALDRFFKSVVPPVCSTKSLTGHVLGASAVVGVVVGVVAMNHGLIPPTVNFTEPRPGCPFDFVPNEPREQAVSGFVVQVAGFGGVNAVAMVGLPSPRFVSSAFVSYESDVVITGVGVVSPLGPDAASTANALAAGRSAVGPVRRFDVSGFSSGHAAEIDGSQVQRLAARLGLKRADLVVEYAVVAAAEACRQAGLNPFADGTGERIGLVIGTTRGEARRFELYIESARGGDWDSASPLHFPHLVMSALGGQVSKALGLKGTAFTIVDGNAAGLHALCHAVDALRSHHELDAIVVVAADELTARYFGSFDRLGRLAPENTSGNAPNCRPYDPESAGAPIGRSRCGDRSRAPRLRPETRGRLSRRDCGLWIGCRRGTILRYDDDDACRRLGAIGR